MIRTCTRLGRLWAAAVLLVAIVFSPTPAQALPDLIISQVPTGPSEVLRGEADSVVVEIRNQGDTATPSGVTFDVTVYLSADSTPTSNERVGDIGVASALAAGATRTVKVPFQISGVQPLGDYTWLVVVDAAGSVSEGDENNNLRQSLGVAVVPTPPDLVVSVNPVGPASMGRGIDATVSATVENVSVGSTTAAGFDVSIFLSTDTTLDAGDTFVAREIVSSILNAGQVVEVNIPLTIPADQADTTYYWLAAVDHDGLQSESDETNNLGIGNTVEILISLPDLVVSGPPTGPNAAFRQGAYTVSVTIANSGVGPVAADFDVVVYMTEDTALGDEDDVRVGDVAIVDAFIQPGDTLTVNVPIVVASAQPLKAHHWMAVVDGLGLVEESDEENNVLLGNSFSVLASPPDLVVSSSPVGEELVVRNGFYDVALVIGNVGGGQTTGAFQVSVYLSEDDIAGNEDDVRVGNSTVTATVLPDELVSLTIPVTVPSEHAFGTYRWAAVVDAGSVETELNETNNGAVSSEPIIVSVSPPDLRVITDPAGPAKVLREGTYSVTASLQNNSQGPVIDDYTVAAYLSPDAALGNDGDFLVGETRISGGMGGGEIVQVSVTVTVPLGVEIGDFRWGLRVDSENEVLEVTEDDNDRVGIAVSVLPFPPDLRPGDELLGPGAVTRGRLYSVPVTIQNVGTGSTISDFSVAVVLTEDGTVGNDDDVLAGTAEVSGTLAPGDTKVVDVSVIVPSSQSPGIGLRWGAIVNAENRVVESDLTNNTILGNTVGFPVLNFLPDSLGYGTVRVGESKSQVFEITNGGTAVLSFVVEPQSSEITTSPTQVQNLAVGATWAVTVTVAPTVEGPFTGSLLITTDGEVSSGTVRVGGTAVVPAPNVVSVDMNPTSGQQNALSRGVGPNQHVRVDLFVDDLPDVKETALQIRFDPALMSFVTNGWNIGGFVTASGALLRTDLVSEGVLSVGVEAQSGTLGSGSGHLGSVTFTTLPAFGSGDSTETRIEPLEITYVGLDDVTTTLQVLAAAVARYDVTCWADIDGSGDVGFGDFVLITRANGASDEDPGWDTELLEAPSPATPLNRYDVTGDGLVGFEDFVIFVREFGKDCTP